MLHDFANVLLREYASERLIGYSLEICNYDFPYCKVIKIDKQGRKKLEYLAFHNNSI